jgi:hypothetical protein
MPRAEHLERDEDPEAARTYLAAARSQTAESRQELALRLVERGLALVTGRTDAPTWRCAFGTISRIAPCRKKGRSRRICAAGRISKTDETTVGRDRALRVGRLSLTTRTSSARSLLIGVAVW